MAMHFRLCRAQPIGRVAAPTFFQGGKPSTADGEATRKENPKGNPLAGRLL